MSKLGSPVANGETEIPEEDVQDNEYKSALSQVAAPAKLSLADIKKNPAIVKMLIKAAKLKKEKDASRSSNIL